VGKSGTAEKSFVIAKQLVWEAYERVKANNGAPGVDEVSIAAFESDLKNNLYEIWNRMSSGTYFPPPVRAVENVGVPTVGDRIAETVVLTLEPRTEAIFHADSYGYQAGAAQGSEQCFPRGEVLLEGHGIDGWW
jgi:retron-type reverse transcriptase